MDTVKPQPTFTEVLGRAAVTKTQLARAAGISPFTIHAALNASNHPARRGGLRCTTAWKIAKAFARLTVCSDDDAYRLLFRDGQAAGGHTS